MIIGVIFLNKKRKKRANELDDDFEYTLEKNEKKDKLKNEEESNESNSLFKDNNVN